MTLDDDSTGLLVTLELDGDILLSKGGTQKFLTVEIPSQLMKQVSYSPLLHSSEQIY
jgi:hypothetical protein